MPDRVWIVAVKATKRNKFRLGLNEHIHACLGGLSRIWVGDALRVCRKTHVSAAHFCAALVLASSLVGGCAISQITSPFRSQSSSNSWEATVTEERLLAAAKSDNSGQVDLPSAGNNCPGFSVWPRDKRLTVYETGRAGDNSGVQHRGELTKTARECQIGTDKVTVKYGFAGRVLLGPRGKSGTLTLPLRVHVTDASRNIVSSEKVNVKVKIPQGMPVGYFSAVREVSFALKSGVRPGQYNVFVAFDRKAAGAS